MRNKYFTPLVITLLSSLTTSSLACTTLIIKDQEKNVYQGRTMEFGAEFPFNISYAPIGRKYTSEAPKGHVGLTYIGKHAYVGVTGQLGDHGGEYLADGINDAGLTFTINSFKGGEGSTLRYKRNVLEATRLGSWVLSQFTTVAETKLALQKQDVYLTPISVFNNASYPFHIAIFDRSGKGIVIEYINGKQIIYDNTIGVMTNGPDFNWHLANLDNYTSITNMSNSTAIFNNYKTQAVDVGGNLMGLPADDASPSRFVRAAFYSNYATIPESREAIATLGKIMNKFDRVRGITNFNSGSSNSETVTTTNKALPAGEWTLWTSLRDLNNTVYYVRPENSLNYYKFDLRQLMISHEAFSYPLLTLTADNRAIEK